MTYFLKYECGVEFPRTEKMILGEKFQRALNSKYAGEDYKDIIDSMGSKHKKIAATLIEEANHFDGELIIEPEYIEDFGIGIPVKFIPDLLVLKDDEYTIIENKYTSGFYNKDSVKDQYQGSAYYYGISKMFGKPTKVKYQLFNNRNKTVELVDVHKNGVDIADLITWMNKLLHKIKECYNSDNWIMPPHSKYPCDLGKACLISKI